MFPKSRCRNLFRHNLEQLREGALQQRIASRCRSGMPVPKYTASLWNRQLRAISDPLARDKIWRSWHSWCSSKINFSLLQHRIACSWILSSVSVSTGRKPHGLQWLWSIKNWYPKSWGSWCTLTEFWTWKVSHWCDWHFCFVNPEILHHWEILHLQVLVFVLCRHLYDPILGDEATEVGVVQLKTSWLILGNNGLQFLKHLIFLLPHRIQIHKCPCDRRRLVPAVWTAFAS